MKNDVVFSLIKSMTQSEKRYFRRYSSLHSEQKDNNYVQLFDRMESMKNYDESGLAKKIANKHFAQLKRHLMIKLLESLRAFNKSRGIENNLYHLICNHYILKDKGIHKQSKKELHKAKTLSAQTERHYDLIKTMQIETTVLREEKDLDALEKHLAQLQNILSNSVKALENELSYEQIYINMVKWNKEIEFVRNKNEQHQLDKILQQDILTDESKALSSKSNIYFHYIKGLYYFFSGNFETSALHFEQQWILFREHPHNIEENKMMYIRTVGNYCLLNIKTGNIDKFKIGFDILTTITASNRSTNEYLFYLQYMLRLMKLSRNNEFEEAVELINKNENAIQNMNAVPSEDWYLSWMYVSFDSVSAYMGLGDHDNALKTINDFLNTANPKLKQDSYCIARVINLLIHFELDNWTLLEYMLESTNRYLKNKKRLYAFEKSILGFIKKATKTTERKEEIKTLKELKASLSVLINDTFEKNVFEHFNFIGWLNLSIKNRTK